MHSTATPALRLTAGWSRCSRTCAMCMAASHTRSRVGMTVSYSPYGALLRSLDVLHSLHYWYRCHTGASTGHRPSHCLANMSTLPPWGLDHDTKAQSTHLNPVRRDSSVGMAPDKELLARDRYLFSSSNSSGNSRCHGCSLFRQIGSVTLGA